MTEPLHPRVSDDEYSNNETELIAHINEEDAVNFSMEVYDDHLAVCLECGMLQCVDKWSTDSCTSSCSNIIFVDTLDDIEQCILCNKFSQTIDIQQCCKCSVRMCLRCNWECNYNNFCEKCISKCEFCHLETKFYKQSSWCCIKCNEVACNDCLNESGLCALCA